MKTTTLMLGAALVGAALAALAPAAQAEPLACSELVGGEHHCEYYVVCVGPYYTEYGWRTCKVGLEDPRHWPCTCDPMPEPIDWGTLA